MKVSKGQVRAVATGGVLTVRRLGKATDDRASVDRQVGSVAAAGDWVLLIEQAGQLWAIALLGTSPSAIIDPPDPDEQAPEATRIVRGTDTVPPTWSGTYRSGSWRSDTDHMVQGPSSWGTSRGAAFFGRKLRSLPGSITSAQVRCERLTYGSYAASRPRMALLAGTSRPSGFPSVRAEANGPLLGAPGSVEWWTMPASWLADLNSGAAGGIGVIGDTYMRLHGPGLRVKAKWRDER